MSAEYAFAQLSLMLVGGIVGAFILIGVVWALLAAWDRAAPVGSPLDRITSRFYWWSQHGSETKKVLIWIALFGGVPALLVYGARFLFG